jgi:D-3-phosphoglycerate dehydrogenase
MLGNPGQNSRYAWTIVYYFREQSNSRVVFCPIGIVGYGHIGSQLSVLAQAMGMNVIYYDVITLMALGTSRQVSSLEELLHEADFVTLHVPDLPETRGMISTSQLEQMKQGSYLINASRGTVVDIAALVKAMRSGKVAGAALDVYPNEPAANGDYFNNALNSWGEELRSLSNIILTPHIGGSTEEAQRAIGVEGNFPSHSRVSCFDS